MLPGERPAGADTEIITRFLQEEAGSIARLATRFATARLGLSGIGVKRNIRTTYLEQIKEAARLFELYGEEAPALFGESQRRHGSLRLTQGMYLSETIEETSLLNQAILEAWGRKHGDLPVGVARLLTAMFDEASTQVSDVYLTFQRSEASAFKEAALLQTLVSHLNEAIFLIERDGVISYVSPVLQKITDYPPQLIVGGSILGEWSVLEKFQLRDRYGARIPAERLPARVALETGTRQHMDVVLMRRRDGTDSVLEIDCVPIFDEEKQLRGVVATVRDRTRNFRKEQELQAAYRELRKLHARLLSRTRLEAVGGLAQSVAHALNNQLNVIALRLKKMHAIPEASADAEAIERAMREIANLVARLQEFASAPEHRAPSPVNLDDIIGDAIALTRSETELSRVSITFERGATSPVTGDRETLLEFFTALILGKVEALGEGGALLVETYERDGRTISRIIDTGRSLSEREIGALFEPLAPGAAGRILSLAAGRDAVRRWGGDVRVLRGPEEENIIEIELPVFEGVRPTREERPLSTPTRGARSVLVVDDDPDNAEMLSSLVEDAGATSHAALKGQEGIELAEEISPDAALVDLLLPDMDGWEVVRQLKKDHPDMRVAVVSGLAVGEEDRHDGLADEIFRKPVSADDLLSFLGL